MTARQFLSLLALGTIWGASYLFIKVAVADIPPFTIVLARTAMAGLCLLAVIRLAGKRLPSLTEAWRPWLVVGFFNCALPYTLINWGEIRIESGLAAIFVALMPLFTVAAGHFTLPGERFSLRKGIGVVLGLAGVALLIGPSAAKGLGGHVLGQTAVAGAAASYAIAALYTHRVRAMSPLVLAFGQMAGGFVFVAPLSLVFDRPWSLAPSGQAILSLVCLALAGTALAYVMYFDLLAKLGPTKVSLVTYVSPLTGVLWGYLVLGEHLPRTAFLALLLVLGSVASVGGVTSSSGAVFDPFAWAARFMPERALHIGIRLVMSLLCLAFLARRIAEFGDYLLKPLWAAETIVYLVLIAAYFTRTEPVDRSRGAAEILLPGIGALLPFTLLFSSPTAWVLERPSLQAGVFWAMTAATALTVWGLWTLRRSFSITVEAREPVTTGPYRWVRHPVYLGEVLAASAVALWRLSMQNVILLAAFAGIQLVRARMEERKMSRNFPDYREWAGRTWWVWK